MAFVVDCLVFLGLAVLLLYPLTLSDQDRFRIGTPLPDMFSSSTVSSQNGQTIALLSTTWTSSRCVEPKDEPAPLLALIGLERARTVLICAEKFLGLASGHTGYVEYFQMGPTVTGQQGDTTITAAKRGPLVAVSLTTDVNGTPVRAIYPLGLMTFGLMLIVAARGWRTPGKMLAGLRVESADGTCRACREWQRLGPFVLGGAFAMVTGLAANEIALSSTLQTGVLILQLGFWAFVLWYHALPALGEGSRARYDRATKVRVVLA